MVAVSALAASALPRSDARAGLVDFELRPVSQTVTVGQSVQIELYAVSADGADQTVGFIGAVLVWDASVLGLTGNSDAGAFAWDSSGFPWDAAGVNDSLLDGDAYYQAAVAVDGPLAVATAGGLLVTTLQFTALSSATGPAYIQIVPCVGSTCSVVLDRHPFNGAADVTGNFGSPVEVIVQCQTSSQCDDANPCTDDACNTGNVCVFTPDDSNDPDDGLFCNGHEICVAGVVVVEPGSVPNCDDAVSCTTDSCNEAAHACDHVLDQGYCLIGGECYPAGDLNPANACEACLPASDVGAWSVQPPGAPCGNPRETDCNGADTCDGLGACQANLATSGTPCGDPSTTECTSPDTCDGAGVCEPNDVSDGTLCDDGLFCTTASACAAGVCVGTGTPCPDQVCDEQTGTCKAVDVELRPLQQGPAAVGATIEIQLYLVSGTAGDQPVSALDAVLVWDPSRLGLLGHVDNGPYTWFVSGFPDDSALDGLNDTFVDGDALFEVLGFAPPSPPALATPQGLLATTLQFEALTAGTTQVELIRDFGQFSQTKVLDAETLGLDITGALGPPASADIVECLTDPDCDDGEFCTGVATCIDNVCNAGTPPDCDDGVFCNGVENCELGVGCVSPGNPCPDPQSCDENSRTCGGCAAPVVVAEGDRYVGITPASGPDPLAILVVADPDDPGVSCLSRYVQADGTLGAAPVYRTPAEWGTVHLAGVEIIPGTAYRVHADCRQNDSGFLSNPVRATTWAWGDVNNDGAAQMDDIVLVFDGSQGVFGEGVTPQSLDLAPCAVDGNIDDGDVTYVQNAFVGLPFPCPAPCEACTSVEAPQVNPTAVGMNRFISFIAGNTGRMTAIRVTFIQLPPPHDTLNGLSMWVGGPGDVCENAGQTSPPEGGCASAPGLAGTTFTAAPLQCEPHFADWSSYGAVYVYGEAVIPNGTYGLQAIDEVCDTSVESHYSSALERTTSGWGDVVKDCTTNPCGPPDGVVALATDVTSIIDKFKNLFGAPIKARCDLVGVPPTDGMLDLKVQILDVTHCLGAFTGSGYPFPPVDPCATPARD